MTTSTYFFCTLLALFALPVRAQTQPAITFKGHVVDPSQAPIPFATVLVLKADSSLLQADATDVNGTFSFPAPALATYRLRVTAVGFVAYTSAPRLAAASQPTADFGTITLAPAAQALGEVVVQGERPAVESRLGTTILNVTSPLFKTAGTALDVLDRAPGLTVDAQGGLTVGGRYAPVVYIEGRQQPLTTDELRNLQASDIDQIEISHNASAQYDGETRAVINIKLKRNTMLGWRGSLYGGYSQNQRQLGGTAGGSTTYKTKRWTYYGNLGYTVYPQYLLSATQRQVATPQATARFDENTYLTDVYKPLSYQFSADNQVAKNQQVGLFLKGSYVPDDQQLATHTQLTTQPTGAGAATHTLLDATNQLRTSASNVALDLHYAGTLNSHGDQLRAFADYATYHTPRQGLLQNTFESEQLTALRAPFVLASQFTSDVTISSLRADYNRGLGKSGQLELGGKLAASRSATDAQVDSLQTGSVSAGTYVPDASRSNQFRYQEQLVAGYAQATQTWKATTVAVGLRVEGTISRGNSLTLSQVINRQYVRWLPSLLVEHKFNELNSLSASYSRKLERPSFQSLNPAPVYTDYYSYVEGNPFLLPVTHTLASLAYQHKDLRLGLHYSLDQDGFAQTPLQDNQTNVLHYTQLNLGRETQYWVDATAAFTLAPWWRVQHYAQLLYLRTQATYPSGSAIDTHGVQFTFNGSQVFTLPKGFSLEVKYTYDSPTTSYLFYHYSNGTVGLGLQKDVLQKRGSLQLTAGDLLGTYRERLSTQYQNLDLSIQQRRGTRQVALRFTYSFGKSTFSRKSQATGSADEENRAR